MTLSSFFFSLFLGWVLNKFKLKTVEFLASFKLGIKVFRTNYFLFTGKTSRKGSNRAMVADSSKDIKGWLLVNNLFC